MKQQWKKQMEKAMESMEFEKFLDDSIASESDKKQMEEKLCDGDCNKCPIVNHGNSRLLTKLLNEALDKFGNPFYNIIQKRCPNMWKSK